MSNETPAEVLADITIKPTITREEAQACQRWAGMDGATAWHLIDRHADNWADVGLMMDAWLEANRSLAAGKVAPVAWILTRTSDPTFPRVYMSEGEADRMMATNNLPPFCKKHPVYTAPPADPAKASEQNQILLRAAREVLSTELGEMACVESHAPAENALGLLALAVAQYPEGPAKVGEQPAEVIIDFPGLGHAGPFPVVSGQVTLPAATMSNLAHHFRMGYVAKASGSAQSEGCAVCFADCAGANPPVMNCPMRGAEADATPPASAPEVTESMVKRACNAYDKKSTELDGFCSEYPAMHAALTAALQEGKSHDQ